jgi:hypothetical protein
MATKLEGTSHAKTKITMQMSWERRKELISP